MTFEEWYAAVDKNVFRSGEEHMKVAFAAGAEQMREKSAQFLEARAKQVGPNFGMDDAIRVLAYAIRDLPVGESSRAPEGTKP